MKLKFRADKKDIIMFIILCIFLLYIVAIAVLNIKTFSNNATFFGLNPLPAFLPENLLQTIAFYFLTLIAIFASVSSYFFEREKGVGLITSKKEEKGYTKWMEASEMKKAYDIKRIKLIDDSYDAAGVPIINDGKYAWIDDGENHTLVIGSTGSGKTACLMHPMVKILAKKGESMIIMDPKGELYKESGNLLRDKGYKVLIINFRDPTEGDAWNPFTLPYRLYKEGKSDKAMELLEDLGNNILKDPKNPDSAFWENTAADYFAGLSIGLFEDAPEEQININSVNYMANVGEERIGPSTYVKEYFTMKGEQSSAYISASATINAPADTKGGITSTFRSKTRIFSSREPLSEMLSHSDFDLRDIGREKTALFIVIHDEKTTYHALATVLVKQIYESLIDVASKCENLKLKYRTNFILDEFANMPALKDVESMITASRSRNIRFVFAIQNFSQLNKVYGKDVAETIKGNCGNMVFLITTELAALEEISKLCGEVKPPKAKDGQPKDPIRPLVTVSDLQEMKMFEVLINRYRNRPFKTKLTPHFKINWGKEYEQATFPTREIKKVEVFDIKKFVMDKRKEKGLDFGMPGGFPPFNPFGGPSPFGSAFPPGLGESAKPPQNNFDLDDLVKRIDEKINELEEEESKEKEGNKNIKDVDSQNIEEVVESKDELPEIENEEEKQVKKEEEEKVIEEEIPDIIEEVNEETEEIIDNDESEEMEEIKEIPSKKEKETNKEEPEKIEKPKINIDVDSIIVDDNVTDDAFFDDFFEEDE